MNTARHATATLLARCALLLALGFSGLAMAQGEATLDQVYQAAQAGHVDKALDMMQPVLKAHPGSGKAHFVQAELLARQGQLADARAELRLAEQLAPGLPFAKAESVQHLQRELGTVPGKAQASPVVARTDTMATAAPQPGRSSVPWGVVLALGGGALAAWMLMRLGRPAATPVPAPNWPLQGAGAPAMGTMTPTGPAGPAMPMGPMGSMGAMGQPGWGAAGGMAPQAPGLGSRVAGGLATGLAVGAGVMAAETIGRNLFGGSAHAAAPVAAAPEQAFDPEFGNAQANADMGGNDFGISDAGSWDDVAPDSSDWDT